DKPIPDGFGRCGTSRSQDLYARECDGAASVFPWQRGATVHRFRRGDSRGRRIRPDGRIPAHERHCAAGEPAAAVRLDSTTEYTEEHGEYLRALSSRFAPPWSSVFSVVNEDWVN